MRALLLVVLAAVAPASMVAQFEEIPSDRRQLRNGLEVLLLWPEQKLAGSATVSVAYISARPDQLEVEAQEVWAEIRADVEKKGIGRVALRRTVFERGFKWHNGRPSFWRTSTTTATDRLSAYERHPAAPALRAHRGRAVVEVVHLM